MRCTSGILGVLENYLRQWHDEQKYTDRETFFPLKPPDCTIKRQFTEYTFHIIYTSSQRFLFFNLVTVISGTWDCEQENSVDSAVGFFFLSIHLRSHSIFFCHLALNRKQALFWARQFKYLV